MTRRLYALILLLTAFSAHAIDSTGSQPKDASVLHKTYSTRLYYATFASPSFNPSVSGSAGQACPNSSVYVNAPVVRVPSLPTGGPTNVYMWQCAITLDFWSSGGVSTLDTTDIDTSLKNPTSALAAMPNWEEYTKLASTQYTLYQFPNNAYVPIGIGGSGLGCGSAGGNATVTCTAGGNPVGPFSVSSGKWIYYIQPGQDISCTLHRDYGSAKACTGPGCPCDGQYSLTGGQVLIGACCNGKWKTNTSNFYDPAFNTCGGGC
jgi:hypothetical protein